VIHLDRPFQNRKARDLLREDGVVLSRHMSLRGAARLLARAGWSTAPVTDARGRCVGLLPASALVRWAAHGRPAGTSDGAARDCAWSDWQVLDNEARPLIAECRHVQTAVPFVTPDTPLPEVACVMAEAAAPRVVVVDARRRPLGIISALDLLTAVLGEGYLARGPASLRPPRNGFKTPISPCGRGVGGEGEGFGKG
jgi:CBS domain-containing protein